MKKRILMMLIVFLLVISLVSAVDDSSDCGFFCKVSKWWSEFRGEEAVKRWWGRGLKMGRLDFKWDGMVKGER